MSTVKPFSDDVLDKATALVEPGVNRVKQDETYPHVWWVTGSGSKVYRVQEDYDEERHSLTWVTCTCPHGLNRGAGEARCYHVAAVLMLIDACRPQPDPQHPETLYADSQVELPSPHSSPTGWTAP